jgi:hypothetical protein
MRILVRKNRDVAAQEPRQAIPKRSAKDAPAAGAYLTDGGTLYRVAHLLSEGPGGETFLELEDCSTLELVLCPLRTALGLRAVTPTTV